MDIDYLCKVDADLNIERLPDHFNRRDLDIDLVQCTLQLLHYANVTMATDVTCVS
jgi:hypothetical protein